MNKNTEISERIYQILKFQGVNKNEFAKKLNYPRSQTVYDIIKGKSAPSFDFFNRLANSEYSENLNMNWLLTGKGEMFITGNNYSQDNSTAVAEPVSLYSSGIPLIPVEAMAGLKPEHISISQQDIMERYTVPDFTDIDFMIRVKGSSMYPKYNSGDVVACKMIDEDTFIQWNKVHVVATKEQGVLIKRLKKSNDQNCLQAISDNKDYDPFDIPKNEILNIALVKGVIRLE